MQGPLDRVLARLVPGDALGRDAVRLRTRRTDDVEVLADVELDAQLVPHRPGRRRRAGHQLVGEHEGEVADQDRHAFAEPPGLTGPVTCSVVVGVDNADGKLMPNWTAKLSFLVKDQGDEMILR